MNFFKKRLVKVASLYLIIPALVKSAQIFIASKGKQPVVASLTQHLGDNIAAEPLDTFIKENFPESFLVRIVGRSFVSVVDNNPNFDFIVPVSCLSEWIFMKPIVRLFARIYDYHVHHSFCLKYRLKLSNPNVLGIDATNYFSHGNLLEVFCKNCGIKPLNVRPLFRLSNEIEFSNVTAPYVILHITSNNDNKEWTRDKWLQLIEFFAGKGMTVIEVGLVSNLNCTHPSYINYCGKLSLLQIAGVISECRYFVGIDSAFAHFANAFNVPRLILLGHFNQFTYYLPYSGMSKEEEMQTVIHFDGQVRDLPFETVKSKIMID